MAIYHLHVSIISRKTGRSAVASAAYRAADKIHNEQDGITHDYTNRSSVSAAAYRAGEQLINEQGEIHDFTNKRGVVYNEIILPENAPKEFEDRSILWNAVEKSEKRKDAQTAREIDVALPKEFDRNEQIEIMRKYIQDNFVDKGMCADFAIHDKQDGNPHAHIMLTTRHVTKSGFGKKNTDWNKKEYLKEWRENWANVCNEKLQAKKFDERIDHRTLKAQGIDREPTIHIGVSAKNMERKGIITEKVKRNNEIIERNRAKNPENIAENMHELKENYCILNKEITELKKLTAEARREMNILRHKSEEIAERAGQIQDMSKRIEELKEQKNADKQLIQRLERSHAQATAHFKNVYNITPEESESEVKRLESMAESKKNLQEKLEDKTAPLIAERDGFAFEYQKHKLLVEIHHDNQEIYENLMRLDKEHRHKNELPQERIAWEQSERVLDVITEEIFEKIIKDVQPEQAKKLIEQQEREMEQEQDRQFMRERF